MITEKDLKDICEYIKNDYDFVQAEIEFSPFRDLKVKWSRTYNRISLSVSDYLMEMPLNLFQAVIKRIMDSIRGIETDTVGYGPECNAYLISDEFLVKNVGTYLRRMYRTSIDEETSNDKDRMEILERAFNELIDENLIPIISGYKPSLYYAKCGIQPGFVSTIFRVIAVSSLINEYEDIKYALYHEYNVYLEGLHRFGIDVEPYDEGKYPYKEKVSADILMNSMVYH